MNETVHSILHSRARGRFTRAGVLAGAVTAALVAACCLMLLLWGCSDKRTPPTQSSELGYTETIDLFNQAESAGTTLAAPFTVQQQLAPIVNPGVDTPARLVMTTYIQPDGDTRWYEAITEDTMPAKVALLGALTIRIGLDGNSLDLLKRDSTRCALHPDSCTTEHRDSVNVKLRTLRGPLKADSVAALIRDSLFCAAYPDSCDIPRRALIDSLLAAAANTLPDDSARFSLNVIDSTQIGVRRDSLARVLDNRYTLALWMDSDTTTIYPEGVFTDTARTVGSQRIWAVPTDTTTGYKGRGFRIAMDRFTAADPININLPITINWTVCFAGSIRPCMNVGQHTLQARLTGPHSRITAAIMLVYAERRRS